MKEINEQQLLALIRNSDYAAFEELHRRYYKSLYVLAVNKLGDQDEAYDLLQDMFIELWDKREQFSINNPLKNYLKNRLWFKLSGYFRTKGFKEKHFKNFLIFLQQEQETSVYLDELDVKEIDIQYNMVMEVINLTISDMPEKMREVFLMSRSNDYSINEIAEKLTISPKTVKNQINMAMNRIRRATDDAPISVLQLLILIWLTK